MPGVSRICVKILPKTPQKVFTDQLRFALSTKRSLNRENRKVTPRVTFSDDFKLRQRSFVHPPFFDWSETGFQRESNRKSLKKLGVYERSHTTQIAIIQI
jgi:hypothetical protein